MTGSNESVKLPFQDLLGEEEGPVELWDPGMCAVSAVIHLTYSLIGLWATVFGRFSKFLIEISGLISQECINESRGQRDGLVVKSCLGPEDPD